MARKAELIEKAKGLGLKVSEKNTIAEITEMLNQHEKALEKTSKQEKPAEKETNQTERTAKAGKRSAKAVREAEAEEERLKKAEAVKSGEAEPNGPKKGPTPKPRPHIERRSKAYRKAVKDIDLLKEHSADEAVKLTLQTSTVKFDATVELHVRLNVDPKQADQNVRETVSLPHGTGKTLKVAVIAPKDKQKTAKDAGADVVGEDDLLTSIKDGNLDFDVLIATPQVMPKLGQYAKILGPKGLMPNPKSGTVTNDVAKGVQDAKTGQVEARVDEQGIVHLSIGKVSFGEKKLLENYQTVMDAIAAAKPSSLKLNYIESITLTSSMGPGIKVETQ